MALRIPPGAARLADASGRYEGRMPTIIPAEIAPEPGWAEPEITSYIDAVETLGMICLLCDTIIVCHQVFGRERNRDAEPV